MKRILRFARRLSQSCFWLGLLSVGLTASLKAQTPAGFNPTVNANGEIYALAVQPDGKILVGGQIYNVAGQWHSSITRLGADGSVDPDFHGSAAGEGLGNPYVGSIIVQPDGRILVYGVFYTLSGQMCTNFGRLNADGTLDSSFNPGSGQDHLTFGALLGIQADGKILAGAAFVNPSGQSSNFLARLNSDGSLDPDFKQPAIGPGQYARILSVAFQEDGKLLVGGEFFTLGGWATTNIARLNPDGSPDPTFTSPNFDKSAPWLSTLVEIIALQPDGKLLIGGSFSALNGVARAAFARLNADGTLDSAFDPQIRTSIGVSGATTIVLQADGKILIGGYFGWTAAGNHFGMGRLNPDGSADDSFDTSISGEWIHALTVQTDGSVLVGGDIYWLLVRAQTDVGRLVPSDPATQSLTFDGSTITWLRGGTSPEVWRTSFEYSTNGVDWLSLGAGRRIAGGWQCAPVTCPPQAAIRARGFVLAGAYNQSSWFTETIIGRPGITTQPVSRTNNAGTTAEFGVVAGGTPPLSDQWLKDGVSLVESAEVFGTSTPLLTLSNVIAGSSGNYAVVISNAHGLVTSASATLTVVDPAINVQPVSHLVQGGLPGALSVTAGGTPPLSYQWRKDGADLAGATSSTLTFAEVQWSDRGSYDVVVSNVFGSLTSTVAVLTVNLAALDSFHPTNIVGIVRTMALQPDGKILVASEASEISEPSRFYFVRVNADGTADDTFNASLDPDNGAVYCVAIQPDGKLLVGGWFNSLGGGAWTNLARLHPDGTLDTTFLLDADNSVNCLIGLPDGKTMVGGMFTNLGGQLCTNIGRLNADGTLDTGFQSHADRFFYNTLLAVQPDGMILVGAQLVNSNGWSYCRIERLRPDGTLDLDFANPEARKSESYAAGFALTMQADGKFLVSGSFDSLGGVACTNFGRLTPDGTFDPTYANPHPMWTIGAPGGFDGLAFQTDGRLLVGGYFLTLAGQSRPYLARLEADGSLDETFYPDPINAPYCLMVQPDGKIVVGGYFWEMAGEDRWSLARLNNSAPALQRLSYDGSTVTWLRMGTSPEIWSATFEYSNDSVRWSALGAGARIPGGWQLTGVSVPPGATVRARGLVAASHSSWFVESIALAGPPARPQILSEDASFGLRSNRFGFKISGPAGLTVVVEGSPNLADWFPLATNTLSVAPIYFKDPGPLIAAQQFYRVRLWP